MKLKILKTGMAALALALPSCNLSWQQDGDGNKEYKTMNVATGDRTLTREYSAVLNGRQAVEIRPQVSGKIVAIHIEEGSYVHKGQPLFTIDQVPYKAALRTAEANVRSTRAAVATAQITAESKQELYAVQVISAFEWQTAKNALAEAQAALAQAQAQADNARNDLSYTVVTSPVDGTIGMLPYRVGTLVSSSITDPLCTVSDDKEIHAYFSLSEQELLALLRENRTPGTYLKQAQPVSLLLADGTTYGHKGQIDALSGNIDRNTGAATLRATFPNPDRLLRNGGSGTIIIPYTRKDVIVIPQEATFEIQDRTFVYRVIDKKAISTQIRTFPVNDGKEYIVESGLQAGETIIAEGAGMVQEGAAVKQKNEK